MIHLDSPHPKAPADAIIVPDANLLFTGDFHRSGVDLILTKDDRELVLHDYFKGEKRAPLASPDGAHLTADLVNALAGNVQVSQADGGAAIGKVIGHVTKLAGSATVVRNGVSIILNMGDDVEKGDNVQTGSDSTLGITFIDGTVFGLLSHAKMVLNEMVYDPNGSSNSTLMSLVSGTITFVAGETAKHGDIKIDTPVATMGIRGTACLVTIDFDVSTSVNGAPPTPSASFQVLVEPDGTTGNYVLLDKTTLQPIATVSTAGTEVKILNGIVSTNVAQLPPDVQKLIADVFAQKFSDLSNPVTKLASSLGSGTPPDQLLGSNQTGNTQTSPTMQLIQTTLKSTTTPVVNNFSLFHVPEAPNALATSAEITVGLTTDLATTDQVAGTVTYADINAGDRPTVSIAFDHFTYTDAGGKPITQLSNLQLQQIIATEAGLIVTQDPSQKNFGTATWSYSLPDSAFDFLAKGQKLTLTYVATVDNGFTADPSTEFTKTTFTITITKNAGEVWIHTTTDGNDNSWTTAQNWESGTVPVSTDDVIIATNQVEENTPSYPATIAKGTNAVANSVTMNDFGDLAPELDIASGASLTIGTNLNLNEDSRLNNAGTVTVNGPMELLDQPGPPVSLNQSVVINSGTLNLGLGGDIQGLASITNTGLINLLGGTLNVLVDIANTDGERGGEITVESPATLVLGTDPNNSPGVTGGITGGTVTVNGILDLEGGNFLKNGTLINNHQINVIGTGNSLDSENVTANVALGIFAGAALTIDQGSTVANTLIMVDGNAALTVNCASIIGGTVTNQASGTIGLTGSATLKNGLLGNYGQVDVSGSSNTFDCETATNYSAGAFDITGDLTLQNAASIVNSSSTNTVTVESSGALTLLDTSSIVGGNLINLGNVSVEKSTGAVLDGVNVDNMGVGTMNIDNSDLSATLIVGDGTSIANGAMVIGPFGTLEVTSIAGATLSGMTVNNCNLIQVDPDSQLNLVNTRLNGGTLSGPGAIATATGNTDSILDGVTLKSGTTVTAAVGELDLTGFIVGFGAEIDANSGSGIAVDLESVILFGATLAGLGTIATVSGANAFDDVTIAGGTTVNVTDDTTLALVSTITDAGTIALNSSGDSTQLKISGSVVLDGGGQVTLSDNANNAIVSDGPSATLDNFDTITGAGTIGDSNLALVNSGIIDATGSHPLIIDTGGNLVTNNAGGVLEATAGHTLEIDGNVENDGLIQAGNSGGSSVAMVDITGSITGTGSIEIFNYAKLEIGGSVSSGQTVTFAAAGGAGLLILDDSHDFCGTIVGLTEFPNESLENHVDLKDLTFVSGCMSANFSSGVLTVSNGSDFVTLKLSGSSDRAFEIASDGSGGTLIDDPLASSGMVTIDSGKTLDISGASTATVSFANGNGSTGELVLNNSEAFTGVIAGFAGNGTLANSDAIDLQDINFANLTAETYVQKAAGTDGTLTLSDGTDTASINFSGNYAFENFKFLSDGNGGTLIIDPPIQTASNGGVDQFVFAPASGLTPVQHTITDFNAQLDTIDLRAFGANVSALALIASAEPANGGQDTLITVDSNDSILLKNVHAASLHTSDFIVHV